MGIAERRQRQKEDTRETILRAAWQLVEQQGWQALSIRKIADAIEYSPPVIYDHFDSKEALMAEFTVRGFRSLVDELTRARDQFTDPARQLEAMAYAYWRFAFKNREYYQVMYGLGIPSCDTVKRNPEVSALASLMSDSINNLIKASGNKDADAFLKLHTFWSMLHGLVSINITAHQNNREEMNLMILKDFISGFISGIKK